MNDVSNLNVTQLPTLALFFLLVLAYVLAKWMVKKFEIKQSQKLIIGTGLGIVVLGLLLGVPLILSICIGLAHLIFYFFALSHQ